MLDILKGAGLFTLAMLGIAIFVGSVFVPIFLIYTGLYWQSVVVFLVGEFIAGLLVSIVFRLY